MNIALVLVRGGSPIRSRHLWPLQVLRYMDVISRLLNFIYVFALLGRSVGRFFNVHDERELEGWQRAGTLPRNRYAMGYSPISAAAQGDETEMPLGNRQQQQQERHEESRPQRGRNRMQRVTDTLSRAIPGRKREPTRDEVMKSLPKFWPIVTVLIALIEVSMLVAVIVTGGLAPIKFVPETKFGTVVGFDNITVSADRQIVPNFFIGTSKAALVHAGGMYTPVSHGCIYCDG